MGWLKEQIPFYSGRCMATLTLLLASSFSNAVAPIEAHFIMGMDVQGQRLNLYNGCTEGNVICDDMLLVAANVGQFLQISDYGKRLGKEQSRIGLYPARTKHSLCKDGVTPCTFQGYSFEGENYNGFIDPITKKISVNSNWTTDSATLSYQENTTYLPLVSQSKKVDRLYQASDKALNSSYNTARSEVQRLYGRSEAAALRSEQRQWLKNRSAICGADIDHLPRTQAEKVCFIQQNNARMESYFLWID